MTPTILMCMIASALGIPQPPQLGWVTPSPVTRSASTSLTSPSQPGSRIYYVDPINGVLPASGVFYLWDGVNIIDSTGSTIGAGGVPYGTDPMNPTGPIVAWKHWAAVCPTRGGYGPGVRSNYGAAIPAYMWSVGYFDSSYEGRPPDSPDWWLLKRGTSLDLVTDHTSYRTYAPMAPDLGPSSGFNPGMSIPGGSSSSNVQVLGAYGPTSTAIPNVTLSMYGSIARSWRSNDTGPSFKNAVVMDQRWYRSGRTSPSIEGVANFNTRKASDSTNLVYQGMVFDRVSGNSFCEQAQMDVRVYRCIFIDGSNDPSDTSHTEGVHCSASPDTSSQPTFGQYVTFEECVFARNGYKNIDPGEVESGELASSTVVSSLPATATIGSIVSFNGELYNYSNAGWTQVSDSGKIRAAGTIFDRNLYLSAQAKVLRCTILRGASGEQLRQGSTIDTCFFQTGYLNYGRRYTNEALAAGAGIYRSVFEGVSMYWNATHLTGQIALGDACTNAKVQDNILTKAAITSTVEGQNNVNYYEALGLHATRTFDGATDWQLFRATQANTVSGNIFDCEGSDLVHAYDGPPNTGVSWTFNWPGLVGNSVTSNIVIGTGGSNLSYTPFTGAPATTDTVVTGNTNYASRSAYASATGSPGVERTWKSYMQSIGYTVSSVDGVHEAVAQLRTMHRGNWNAAFTGLAVVNYFRQGWGKSTLT